MKKIAVVHLGHGMAGFYGAETKIYTVMDDITVEEFAKEWIEENEDEYYPEDLERSMGVFVDPNRTSMHLLGDEFSHYFTEVTET